MWPVCSVMKPAQQYPRLIIFAWGASSIVYFHRADAAPN